MTMLSAGRCARGNRDFGGGHLPAVKVDGRSVLGRDHPRRVRGGLLPFDSHLAPFCGQTLAQGGGQQSKSRRQKLTSIISHGFLTVPVTGLTTVMANAPAFRVLKYS